jgi:hypothetical protein
VGGLVCRDIDVAYSTGFEEFETRLSERLAHGWEGFATLSALLFVIFPYVLRVSIPGMRPERK